jgi:hypothetical protein
MNYILRILSILFIIFLFTISHLHLIIFLLQQTNNHNFKNQIYQYFFITISFYN